MSAAHSPGEIDQIVSLARAGLSRSAITVQVGMTRSAVIGALWRRGEKPVAIVRAKPGRPPRRPKCEKKASKLAAVSPAVSESPKPAPISVGSPRTKPRRQQVTNETTDDLAQMARTLEKSGDYRVLRRLVPRDVFAPVPAD